MTSIRCLVLAAALAALAFGCKKKDGAAAVDAAAEAAAAAEAPAPSSAPSAAASAEPDAGTTPLPTATHAAPKKPLNSCPAATQAAFVGAGGAKSCETTCNVNTDCRGDKKRCTGSGTLMNPDGSKGGTMKFCQ